MSIYACGTVFASVVTYTLYDLLVAWVVVLSCPPDHTAHTICLCICPILCVPGDVHCIVGLLLTVAAGSKHITQSAHHCSVHHNWRVCMLVCVCVYLSWNGFNWQLSDHLTQSWASLYCCYSHILTCIHQSSTNSMQLCGNIIALWTLYSGLRISIVVLFIVAWSLFIYQLQLN